MRVIDVVQHSPEWEAHRAAHNNASEAAAMMNESRYITRGELLRIRAGASDREVSEFLRRIYDKGHESEAACRPLAEKVIGETLYPVVAVPDGENPLRLSSSYDGLKMDEEESWEHKLWNEELAAQIRNGTITDPTYWWQLEQQLYIGRPSLKRVLFSCGDESGNRFVHMWYTAIAGRREKMLAGWAQFDEDRANYKHVETPEPVAGRVIRNLPALVVEIEGAVKSSNLAVYRENALAFIESINTTLKTDQDFADAESVVKFCGDAEKRLELAKEQALGRTASIAEVLATLDELRETMRNKRLTLDKLVKARKDSIRAEIRDEAANALLNHVSNINKRLARVRLPNTVAVGNFAEVMKGKKTITGLRDAVDGELARAKIEASRVGDLYGAALALFDQRAKGSEHLFHDLQQLVALEIAALSAVIDQRIGQDTERRKVETERIERQAREKAEREANERQARADRAIADQLQVPVQNREPAPPAAAAPQVERVSPMLARTAPIARTTDKPDDAEIVGVLCNHYDADEATVLGWLAEMDISALREAA